MKITLDLPSVLTGGAVALLLGLVAGFTPQVTQLTPQRPATAIPLNGALRPAARDLLFFRGTDPAFTVPAGKIFVITQLATGTSSTIRGVLEIDGVRVTELSGWINPGSYNWNFTEGGVGGWPLPEGTTVDLVRRNDGSPAFDYEWYSGYLADA